MNRRRFLKNVTHASAPFILPAHIWAAKTKPNDRITMGFIGTGKQNRILARHFRELDGVQMVAVAEVDTTRRKAAQKLANEYYTAHPEKGTADCAATSDHRDIIQRKDIDTVCIATPDHWHAIITLDALKAGKDVYCEKPLTHNISEAVKVMQAVQANGRILQTGSMQRSWNEFHTAAELVRNGVIGKITHVTCSFGRPGVPCDLPEEEMEPGLDWDRWLGPAPVRPYNSILSPRGDHRHYPNWRRYREFGGGNVTDIGAHHFDIAQWGLGRDGDGPVEVIPPEDKTTGFGASMKYEDGITLKIVKGWSIHFHGTDGEVMVRRGQFGLIHQGKRIAYWKSREDKGSMQGAVATARKAFLENKKISLYHSRDHLDDFLQAVRSRQKPIANEVVGGGTAIGCHLLNFAYYFDQPFKWNPKAHQFRDGTGDPKWLTRDYRAPWKLG
jgi:predicted dehydrogenase